MSALLRLLACGLFLLVAVAGALADSQQVLFDNLINISLGGLVNLRDGTIESISNGGKVCAFLASATQNKPIGSLDNCVIHVIRWSEPDPTTHLQSVQATHWYTYSHTDGFSWEDFTSRKRFMGVKELYFFYIHINRAGGPTSSSKGNDYTPQYKIVISKKLSANVGHLLQLLQAFSGQTTSAKDVKQRYREHPDAEFGGGHIDIQYRPSWSDDEQGRRRFRNGEDIRFLQLIDRKLRLQALVPKGAERLLNCDHVEGNGACEHDLEGIVAKRKSDPYLLEHATWLKIRNQGYSQWGGKHVRTGAKCGSRDGRLG